VAGFRALAGFSYPSLFYAFREPFLSSKLAAGAGVLFSHGQLCISISGESERVKANGGQENDAGPGAVQGPSNEQSTAHYARA